MSEQKKPVSRRDFSKKVAIGVAGVAAAAFPVGKACAFWRDENGKTHGWSCFISVAVQGGPFSVYNVENCSTGRMEQVAEAPGLPVGGECAAPTSPVCVHTTLLDSWESLDVDGSQFKVSPRIQLTKDELVKQLRAWKRSR